MPKSNRCRNKHRPQGAHYCPRGERRQGKRPQTGIPLLTGVNPVIGGVCRVVAEGAGRGQWPGLSGKGPHRAGCWKGAIRRDRSPAGRGGTARRSGAAAGRGMPRAPRSAPAQKEEGSRPGARAPRCSPAPHSGRSQEHQVIPQSCCGRAPDAEVGDHRQVDEGEGHQAPKLIRPAPSPGRTTWRRGPEPHQQRSEPGSATWDGCRKKRLGRARSRPIT